eukprot:m.276968 g.276968  ORF g.276968 m.276968 type:complete len:249 (+) comp54863_c0_seq13:1075-1821(+)
MCVALFESDLSRICAGRESRNAGSKDRDGADDASLAGPLGKQESCAWQIDSRTRRSLILSFLILLGTFVSCLILFSASFCLCLCFPCKPPDFSLCLCADNLVLYLSRSHGQTRCVSDEGTLVSGLDGAVRGVQGRLVVLHGINSTSVQHRLLFASARVLLGPHGGAFGNMIYCSAGTHVLEFMPLLLDRPRPCFFGLAHGLGLTHSLLEPAEGTFSFEDPNRKMVISHQHLITAVTHLLALPRPSPSG